MTTQRRAMTWRLATIPVAWLLVWMLPVPFDWQGAALKSWELRTLPHFSGVGPISATSTLLPLP